MLKVVLVEDEPLVRQGLALAVDWASMGCVVVGEAEDGEEGCRVARKTDPDLILTDVRMPRMDGISMIARLRQEGCRAEFIILTAYSDFEYAHSALKLGVTDYLLKPFEDDSELEAAVEKIRQRLAQRAQPAAGGGLFRFDLDKGAKSKYVEEAVDYIRQNYAQRITISSCAEAVSLSEGYLSRLFRKETGYTFNAYLAAYRIHVAMRLLRDHHMKVYEVAPLVGYADTAYFSTLFKKAVGISPSEYQDRCE
ncbi:MAG TPA: response regulator [Candidatus Fournierella merdigallinarum]|nr:response regulator [Candidatus Fournierella merdigallinarum]